MPAVPQAPTEAELLAMLKARGGPASAIARIEAIIVRRDRREARQRSKEKNLRQAVSLARKGMRNAEIARQLGLSRSYVGELLECAKARGAKPGRKR